MNIITFDIEEWALAKARGIEGSKKYEEYDYYLNKILDTLDTTDTKGTFFCTGMMAQDFPQVIKLIHSRGHEIGCHSFLHTWMNKMTEAEAREDTHSAVDALEQCIGKKVLCYRAPAFSIGESNKWMFEILAENGITHDASIFPATRDFGGFPGFGTNSPCVVEYNGIRIKELPICTTTLLGKELAYSGGGYFRFFSLRFIKHCMKETDYVMCYFHIGDLIPETTGMKTKEAYEAYYKEPGSFKNRYMRYLKSNLGKKGAFNKMCKLIESEKFMNLEQADRLIDWDKAQSIVI